MEQRPHRLLCCGLALLGALGVTSARAADNSKLFRPLTADPRENQFHMKFVRYTEDWRYGTDITDSTSQGGWEYGRKGTGWVVSLGETFRFPDTRRVLGIRGPWIRAQAGIPAGVFANFDRVNVELVNADFQFGGALDLLWSGDFDDTIGIRGFDRPVVTSRFSLYHRSSHIGDEYIAFSAFGRNQEGFPEQGKVFGHPPVKRVDLSYEAIRSIWSVEWAPHFVNGGRSTIRAYAGGDIKVNITGIEPENFKSPIGQMGLEFHSAANQEDPHDGIVTRFFNLLSSRHPFESEWFAAIDLKLAKPYDFASCDNPMGTGEVWTPHLWTDCNDGHEFRRYAGSWHAVAGIALFQRRQRVTDVATRGERLSPEILLTVEWYRGYSPNGQFLDQHLRYRPLGYVLPGLTVHF